MLNIDLDSAENFFLDFLDESKSIYKPFSVKHNREKFILCHTLLAFQSSRRNKYFHSSSEAREYFNSFRMFGFNIGIVGYANC